MLSFWRKKKRPLKNTYSVLKEKKSMEMFSNTLASISIYSQVHKSHPQFGEFGRWNEGEIRLSLVCRLHLSQKGCHSIAKIAETCQKNKQNNLSGDQSNEERINILSHFYLRKAQRCTPERPIVIDFKKCECKCRINYSASSPDVLRAGCKLMFHKKKTVLGFCFLVLSKSV